MTRLGPLISPLLIGRDDVLELAGRRLDEAAGGRGQFVLLSGEAGIGKTRLLSAIQGMAEARGFRVSEGVLSPQDRDVPAAIFLDLGRTMHRQSAFEELGTTLLELLEGIVGAERAHRRVLIQRTVDLLVQTLAARPTMLVFEDLQWADEASLEIVSELARQGRRLRLFLAATLRSEEAAAGSVLREWRSRLVTQRLIEDAGLDRLTLEQTGLMTSLIMGTGLPAPRQLVAAVFQRTDGVPLHIEELLAAVGPEGLADGRAIRDAEVPDSLEDATLRRIHRLSAEAQAVARAGAVLGRSFDPQVVAGILDLPVEAVDAPIEELIANHVLGGPGLRGLYDYRHQLLRDALYRTIPPAERRRFHARAAEFGTELEGASVIHASVHYERAGMREEAFRTALLGARKASQMTAHREATELYARARHNMPEDLDPAEQADLLSAYALEAIFIEDSDLTIELAQRAREQFLAAGDAVGAVECLLAISVIWRWEGHPLTERGRLLRQAIKELEGAPACEAREIALHDAYSKLASLHLDGLDIERARDAIGMATAIADRLGERADVPGPDLHLGALDVIDGEVERGLDRVATVAHVAEERGLATLEHGWYELSVTAYRDLGLLACQVMSYDRASAELARGRRFADRIEMTHCGRVMASTDALVAWAVGQWDRAEQTGRQALADRGRGRTGAIARWALGYVALGRGDHEIAAGLLRAAVDFGEQAEWVAMTLPARWGLAENALLAGDVNTAIAQCELGLGAAAPCEGNLLVPFIVTGVRAYLAAAQPEAAEAWLQRVTKMAGAHSPVAEPALRHGRGLLALAAGSLTAACEHLEAAAGSWARRDRAWELNWARLDLAGALLRANRYVESARLASEVRTSAERLASRPLRERAVELERLGRGRGAEREVWHPLSQREFEVARQVAAGLTNGEIADELGVSPKTASSHVEHILAKLGVARRAEIAAWVAGVARQDATARQGNVRTSTLV